MNTPAQATTQTWSASNHAHDDLVSKATRLQPGGAVSYRARHSLAITLCDPIRVEGKGTPDSVTPRLPGKVQVVIVKGLKHVPLNENIPAVANEGFASMLDLGEEGTGYIEPQRDSMRYCLL